MAEFKLEGVLISLTLCCCLCAAAQKTSRDASHLGYLYEKPARTFETPVEADNSEEVVLAEVIHSPKTHGHSPHEEYLPPKGSLLLREEEEHTKHIHEEKRDLDKNKKKLSESKHSSTQIRTNSDRKKDFGHENRK